MIDLARRSGELTPQSFNAEDNGINLVWTTGARVRRSSPFGETFDEELVVSPKAVRMDRLNAGAPLLDSHNGRSAAGVIGAVVPGSARLEGGKGIARVRLSNAPGHADLVQNIRDGIVRGVSVGYKIHGNPEVIAEIGSVPLIRVTDWEPWEITIAAMGLDSGAGFRDAYGELFIGDHPIEIIDAQQKRADNGFSAVRMRMRQLALQRGI